MVLIIDNYDSFTYNLVQYIGELGEQMTIWRNDQFTIEDLKALNPQRIVISPGPGTPDDAGMSIEVIKQMGDQIPILGICLGHQSIAQAYGGTIVRAPEIVHGKTAIVHHSDSSLFEQVPQQFKATRYHSLVVDKDSFPKELKITATLDNGLIMALEHQHLPIYGLQFHPESIASDFGHQLLKNFLNLPWPW